MEFYPPKVNKIPLKCPFFFSNGASLLCVTAQYSNAFFRAVILCSTSAQFEMKMGELKFK